MAKMTARKRVAVLISGRGSNMAALLAWSALALLALVQGLTPQPWVSAALCLIAVYFLLAGLVPGRAAAT